MITHLRHMAEVRPQGSDRQAAQWALDKIERLQGLLTAKTTPGYELLGETIEKMEAENERLRAALESLTKDPPSTLSREPDEDWEVITKMRAIARKALAGG